MTTIKPANTPTVFVVPIYDDKTVDDIYYLDITFNGPGPGQDAKFIVVNLPAANYTYLAGFADGVFRGDPIGQGMFKYKAGPSVWDTRRCRLLRVDQNNLELHLYFDSTGGITPTGTLSYIKTGASGVTVKF